MTLEFSQIRYDAGNAIATITLYRPDRLNAFTEIMLREMVAAMDAAEADDTVRAVIVTGAGKGFCAGADLSGPAKPVTDAGPGQRFPEEIGGVPRDGGGILVVPALQYGTDGSDPSALYDAIDQFGESYVGTHG